MIIEKISAVSRDLAEIGIDKGKRNKHGGYDYRGIDQIYQTLGPILVRHGVVIFPVKVKTTISREPTGKDDKLMRFALVNVTYMISGGDDGAAIEVNTSGEGFDFGDKALNKAMSGAYKNMVFQTFCPPFEGFNYDSEEGDVEVDTISEETRQAMENFLSPERYASLTHKFGVGRVCDIPVKKYTEVILPHLEKEGFKV